ncbi:MAG: hypothetical protein PF637_13465 [Spirochaetes bacterium]|nr:hypothetical protein [Spirochaetota bacterium]
MATRNFFSSPAFSIHITAAIRLERLSRYLSGTSFKIRAVGEIQTAEDGFAIQLKKEYGEALTGIEGFSYLDIIWWANLVGNTYKYIYETFLPETEYKLPYLYNFEQYGERSLGPDNEESISEIYIPIEL